MGDLIGGVSVTPIDDSQIRRMLGNVTKEDLISMVRGEIDKVVSSDRMGENIKNCPDKQMFDFDEALQMLDTYLGVPLAHGFTMYDILSPGDIDSLAGYLIGSCRRRKAQLEGW